MVLEMIGMLYLAKDFGNAFPVWTSQIGVILIALSLGYAIGGTLADRFKRAGFLAIPMAVAGVFIFFIPKFTPADAGCHRQPPSEGTGHPGDLAQAGPGAGQRGGVFSALLCAGLDFPLHGPLDGAASGERWDNQRLDLRRQHGRQHRRVFISGYIFIDYLSVSAIFRATGVVVFFWLG